jgi:hypothetical protein
MMDIKVELKKYSKFIPYKILINVLEYPISIFPEDILIALPSIILGVEGPILNSLFLLSEKLICEVKMMAKIVNFDFISRNTIRNYRISLSDHSVKSADDSDIHYQLAEIILVHGVDDRSLWTNLKYAGFDRKVWLEMVIKAFPISIIY